MTAFPIQVLAVALHLVLLVLDLVTLALLVRLLHECWRGRWLDALYLPLRPLSDVVLQSVDRPLRRLFHGPLRPTAKLLLVLAAVMGTRLFLTALMCAMT